MNTETNDNVSSNKLAVIHVLAALIQNPLLFADNKYSFSIDDFPKGFHQIVYGAVEHLAKNGMEKIGYIDIDQFLKQYAVQYKVFTMNKGVEYIQNALSIYDEKKFDYYYQALKKSSLLNKLNGIGLSTTDIYDPNIVDPVKSAAMCEKFDNLTVNDIILAEETKLILVKEAFGTNTDRVENDMGSGILGLVDELKEAPVMGLPFVSPKLTTIFRGQRLGCLDMVSAASGSGKALPNSLNIPTPEGWKTIGDIKPGDYLFDGFGKPTRVVNIFPQGPKEVFEITFHDGRTIKCSEDHLWSYCTRGQRPQWKQARKFKTKTLREIINTERLRTHDNRTWNILIPQQKAVEYPCQDHYLPPYVMGAFLGDGSFREQECNRVISFSSENTEIPQIIANAMGWSVYKCSDKNYTWGFKFPEIKVSSNPRYSHTNVFVSDALCEHPDLINTYSYNKYIPDSYLHDSIEHRWELLNGLLDTDGTIDEEKGRVVFTTISSKLKDGFVELCHSLGFQTSVYEDTHKSSLCYDIMLHGSPELKSKLFKLKRKHDRAIAYLCKAQTQKRSCNYNFNAIVGIRDLGYKEDMTCFYVDNDEHLFVAGDFIVTHNTRFMVAQACRLAIPEYYDGEKKCWVNTGMHEKCLLIETELELREVQTMTLAHVADVSEAHILDGRYEPGEEERVRRAAKLISESQLKVIELTNYGTEDLIGVIKKYHQLYKTDYFYYDYLSENSKLLGESARKTKMTLRTDQILLDVATELKDCAKTLNVFIMTATQLSGDYKNANELDTTYLRSAKSLGDKLDCGAILTPVREIDQGPIDAYCAKGFENIPNFILAIYKVRRGSFQNIKVYVNFDRSTCRMTDAFVTDNKGNILPVADTNIDVVLDNTSVDVHSVSDKADDDIGFDF